MVASDGSCDNLLPVEGALASVTSQWLSWIETVPASDFRSLTLRIEPQTMCHTLGAFLGSDPHPLMGTTRDYCRYINARPNNNSIFRGSYKIRGTFNILGKQPGTPTLALTESYPELPKTSSITWRPIRSLTVVYFEAYLNPPKM